MSPSATGPTGAAASRAAYALRKRIEHIILASHDWSAWLDALDTLIEHERARQAVKQPLHMTYCLDTSEVIEYVRPLSRLKGDYPTPLDISLLILFDSQQQRSMLPPHYIELSAHQEEMEDQAREDAEVLTLFRELLQRLETSDDPADVEDLVEFMLKRRRFFGRIFEKRRPLHALIGRLERLDREFLYRHGIEDWRYRENPERLRAWYEDLSQAQADSSESEERGEREPPAFDRIDAHALCFLEDLNADLPDDQFVILSTHSWRIWHAVRKRRAQEEEEAADAEDRTLMKQGVSLVERPQTVFAKKLVGLARRSSEGTLQRTQMRLVIERERLESIMQLRSQLQSEMLPYLEQGHLGPAELVPIKAMVRKLEHELGELKTLTQDRQVLGLLGIATEEDGGDESRKVRIAELIRTIRAGRRAELTRIISDRWREIVQDVEELQRQVTLTVPAIPDPTLTFEGFERATPLGLRGILHSRRGGTAYDVVFPSPHMADSLRRITRYLQRLDEARAAAGNAGVQGHASKRELQKELYQLRHAEDPEIYLLLASVFSSRQMWFQAFDAADQGLKRLAERPEAKERKGNATRAELLLVRAVARRNWTLAGYKDLPVIAEGLLAKAAADLRESLALQAEIKADPDFRDPRCLRELGIIFGTAREANLSPPFEESDRALLGEQPSTEPIDRYLGFSRLAFKCSKPDDPMRVYYVNSLLYALTEKDQATDLPERVALAAELDAAQEAKIDPNLLDTRAWHRLRLVPHFESQNRRAAARAALDEARQLIALAVEQLPSLGDPRRSNRYYTDLIRNHHDEIERATAG